MPLNPVRSASQFQKSQDQSRELIPNVCSSGTFQYQILYQTRFYQRSRITQVYTVKDLLWEFGLGLLWIIYERLLLWKLVLDPEASRAGSLETWSRSGGNKDKLELTQMIQNP